MPIRDYSGTSKATALSGAITAATTIINVVDATGYPTGAGGPFVLTIDRGVTTEEKVLCSGRTGNSLTVQVRGFDGTTASDHGNAATVEHTLSATDIREANAHVNDTTGDPHPQYLTATEGAALYSPGSHGHNYSDPAHTHTYDSLTLKPAEQVIPPSLVVVSDAIDVTFAGSAGNLTGATVTFTAPASGRVLVRLSGYVSCAQASATNSLTISGTVLSNFTIPGSGSYAINGVHVFTATAGASVTYAVAGTTNSSAQVTWKGRIEVWAAP